MKPFSRSDRVGGLIQQVLSDILRKDIKDPRLKMITISGVKMSPDLRIAKVYYTTSGGKKNREESAEGFKKATGYLKRSLARQVDLRYMPELKFFFDDSFDYGTHIDKLLASLNAENGSNNTSIEK